MTSAARNAAVRQILIRVAGELADVLCPVVDEVSEAVSGEIRDFDEKPPTIVTFDRILANVSRAFLVSRHEIFGRSRGSESVDNARSVSMWLTREVLKWSFPRIGREFDGRDHSTVQVACRKVDNNVLLKRSAELIKERFVSLDTERFVSIDSTKDSQ